MREKFFLETRDEAEKAFILDDYQQIFTYKLENMEKVQ